MSMEILIFFISNFLPHNLSLDNFIMNIGGSEWVIIAFLFLFLIVGSKKLPEFTRLLGRAVGEYQKSRETFFQNIHNTDGCDIEQIPKDNSVDNVDSDKKNPKKSIESVYSDTFYNIGKSVTGPFATEREKLEKIAISLGITDLNKTDDELWVIINKKISL